MFLRELLNEQNGGRELVGLCDTNMTRMKYVADSLCKDLNHPFVPQYRADDFERMVNEQKPDCVITTSVDSTHHDYICRAMDLGCDAITEKPMTTDPEKCQQIIDKIKATGKHLKVTFNARYSPLMARIKELILADEIGEILSVNYEELLDTKHGANYFRRWHRDKSNSGGLLIHKSTHHFDLVNWWLDDEPDSVFAYGRLGFYGKENAKRRGVKEFYERAHGSASAAGDPFALHLAENPDLKAMFLDAEKEDGYIRDQSVFGSGISIEDNMSVMVRYRKQAILTYTVNAHCPWEGMRIMFNGTKGRIEVVTRANTSVSAAADDDEMAAQADKNKLEQDLDQIPSFILQKHWQKPIEIPITKVAGGHGGADTKLLEALFNDNVDDPLNQAASYKDGAMSLLIGAAANKSMESGLPVNIKDLVTF